MTNFQGPVMNTSGRYKAFKEFAARAGTVLLLGTSTAQGFEMDILAEFKPDPSKPQHNVFTNLTPSSGYCAEWPDQCQGNKFSLEVPITFNSTGPIMGNHTDPRQGAMFSVPVQWKSVTVVNNETLEQQVVKVRINGFGSEYNTEPVTSLVGGAGSTAEAHSALWGASWVYAPLPCLYSGVGYYGSARYGFFWKSPVEGVCGKFAKYDIPWMRYPSLNFVYEMETPNPLSMSSGSYTGRLTYTLGPHQDFDMGDVMIPDDPLLTLNFILTVNHVLKVEIPPGGNNVQLEPQGGWHQWLQKGRLPEKLYRDQTFMMSVSSNFKMQLACDRVIGDTCALTNNKNHDVPVDIAVSLPLGLVLPDGSAVNHQPLLLSGAGTELFKPSQYVDRQPSTLHFEIQKEHVTEMLFQEGTYSGNVTVIWDSEV